MLIGPSRKGTGAQTPAWASRPVGSLGEWHKAGRALPTTPLMRCVRKRLARDLRGPMSSSSARRVADTRTTAEPAVRHSSAQRCRCEVESARRPVPASSQISRGNGHSPAAFTSQSADSALTRVPSQLPACIGSSKKHWTSRNNIMRFFSRCTACVPSLNSMYLFEGEFTSLTKSA